MKRGALLAGIVALLAVAASVQTAQAGGWAVVTLDSTPIDVRAGETLRIGFMVRQHGQTPIHQAFGERVKAVLSARNTTGEGTVQVEALADTPIGHFVVEATFPSEGVWSWEITPAPFAGTRFEPLTVLAAGTPLRSANTAVTKPSAATPVELESLIAPPPSAGTGSWYRQGATLRWGALLLLVATVGAALAGRHSIGRWLGVKPG